MSITAHERPGVYSSYAASAAVSGGTGSRTVGLAARTGQSDTAVRYISRYEEAVAAFGAETGENVTALVRLLLQNGAAQAAVFPVAGETLQDYKNTFEVMARTEELPVVMCDSTLLTVQQALRDSVQAASQAQRERIAVTAAAAEETVSQLAGRAKQLNCERVVLAAPGCVSQSGTALSALPAAAAIAGAIAAQSDPALPLGGAELHGLYGLSEQYEETELDTLIRSGVTAAESVGGVVSVVRGVTTRTAVNGAPDDTWRELSSILVVDDVIPTVRSALKSRFRRAKNTPQSRGAIRSQVVLELENKLAREIITGYDQVSVQADSAEPTRCLVDFSFTVAHGINQIWLSAHITV